MKTNPNSTRRTFLKTTSATAATVGTALAFPTVTFGKPDSRKLKIGWIGCGGRGSGAINQALRADSNVELWAIGEAFADKAEKGLKAISKMHPGKVNVDKSRIHVGLDAYQKVIESDVDVVILTTPPGFRPLHIKAAVDAKKHIFAEKPMATDGPGARSVIASIAKAKKQGTSIVDGFVWRWTYAQRDTYKRIRDGELGDIQAIFSSYNNNARKRYVDFGRHNTKSDVEYMIRRWYYFTWLSGDHIVEQGIHSIDKMLWAMGDQPPAYAIASGGRQNRGAEEGNIFDHFAVEFSWADGTQGYHFTRQMDGCENGVWDRVFGSKAKYTGESGRKHHVFSNADGLKWRWNPGAKNERNNNGYQTEHDEMYAAIRDGKPLNTGDRMIKTTLTAMMARTAAYTGKKVTWDMMINSKEQRVPENIAWDSLPLDALDQRAPRRPGSDTAIGPHGWK